MKTSVAELSTLQCPVRWLIHAHQKELQETWKCASSSNKLWKEKLQQFALYGAPPPPASGLQFPALHKYTQTKPDANIHLDTEYAEKSRTH